MAEVKLNKIGQIFVRVYDLDRAVEFYRDQLGMKFLFQVPKMAFFDCNGIRLMLGIPETPEFDHPASIIYYQTDDIHSTHQELLKRNVKFLGEPHSVAKLPDRDIWMAFFQDMDNNLLALMNEKPL